MPRKQKKLTKKEKSLIFEYLFKGSGMTLIILYLFFSRPEIYGILGVVGLVVSKIIRVKRMKGFDFFGRKIF